MAVEREQTDLIDVSDMADELEEAVTNPNLHTGRDLGTLMDDDDPADNTPTLASLTDRLAAFLIDGIVLYILYWGLLAGFRLVAFSNPAGPPPGANTHGLVFHGLFLLVALIYFLLGEGVFFATFGKAICRLRLRATTGNTPGFVAILIRNLLRPLDLILFPLLIGSALLEKTAERQRLGDIAARTLVLRLANRVQKKAVPSSGLASASGRAAAFFFDAFWGTLLAIGCALLLVPDEPLRNQCIAVSAPLVFFLWLVLPEALTGTSPGKWLFGYRVCQEDGTSSGVASTIIRTLFRITDTNPWGFLCALLSPRHQRPGDAAAATVVVKAPRQWPGAVSFVLTLLLVGLVVAGGISNENRAVEITQLAGLFEKRASTPANLHVSEFHFAAGQPQAVRSSGVFRPGETLYVVFEVSGFAVKESEAWLKEDLTIRYPDESIGLRMENAIEFREVVADADSVELMNNVALPATATPGRYTIIVTIHDLHSNRQLNEQRFFSVVAAQPPPAFEQTPGTDVEERPAP